MKFFAIAALVATTQAAAGTANSVATGEVCTADTDCSTATDSCCTEYGAVSGGSPTGSKKCAAKSTAAAGSETSPGYYTAADCKGRTAAGAASLAATAAAAATALYAMC